MKKVFSVSVVTAACVFAANAGAEEGKSGFYLTGKAGASVVSLCSGSQNQDTGITCFHFSSCKQGGKPPLSSEVDKRCNNH